jgi:N-methylhydantoinase B/oxoprolinase/acetone carboxylase alpha subunit
LRPHRLRPQLKHDLTEEGDLDPVVFLLALLIFVGVPAVALVKIAQLRARRPQSLSGDVTARLEALERGVQEIQKELAETQERLDFTERLLTKAREER